MNVARIAMRPRFVLFGGRLPEVLRSKPGFTNSLQALDAAWVQVGLQQYPLALFSTAVALESGLREALPCPGHATLSEVVGQAATSWALPHNLVARALELVKSRDRMVAEGCLANDDELAAGLMIDAGWPLLERVYRQGYDFDPRPFLPPVVRDQLLLAETLRRDEPDAKATVVWHGFAGAVRWEAGEAFMTPAVLRARDERRYGGDDDWEWYSRPSGDWTLSCPICHSDQPCYLGDDGSDNPVFWVDRMDCSVCGFSVSPAEHVISKALFAEELVEKRPAIAKDLGLPIFRQVSGVGTGVVE